MNLIKLLISFSLVWLTVTLLSILTLPSTSSSMLRGSVIGTYEDNSLSFPIPSPGSYCERYKKNKNKLFWVDLHVAGPVQIMMDYGWNMIPTKSSGVGLVLKEDNQGFNYSALEWAKVNRVRAEDNLELFLLPEEVSLIFSRMYWYKDHIGNNVQTARLGVDYACNKQMLNHVPGASAFCRKDLLQIYLADYRKRYKELGLSHCFNSLTPKSFLLQDPEQCEEFLKITDDIVHEFNETNMPVQWITKNGLQHKGYGIEIVDYGFASYFNALYKSSVANCRTLLPTHQSIIIQKYINSPALIEGRKFDFRVFMMIIHADPLIAVWAPRNGHTRLSDNLFDEKSKDFTTHITANVAEVNQEAFEFLKEYRFNLEEIAEYFKPKIGDTKKWLRDVAHPKIKKLLIHMLRSGQQNFLVKRAGLFEFYGVDLIMDNTLDNFYLLETNRRPDVREKNPNLQYRENQIVEDFMRVADYFLENDFKIRNLNSLYKSFAAFEPLIDETVEDPYFGAIEKECSVRFGDMNWDLPIDPMIEPLKFYIDNYS